MGPSAPQLERSERRRNGEESLCDRPALREDSVRIALEWETWSPCSGVVLDQSLEAVSAVWTPRSPLDTVLRDAQGVPRLLPE